MNVLWKPLKLFSLLIFIGVLFVPVDCKSVDPDFDNPLRTYKCGSWERLILGEYILENNLWGKQDVKNYRQCVFIWNKRSTTVHLPASVTKKKIEVTYDADIKASGIYNLAFDIWICSSPFPTPQNVTKELMIWMIDHGTIPLGTHRADAVIAGITYKLYIDDDVTLGLESGSRKYIAFVAQGHYEKATVPIDRFLSYLVRHNFISAADYIASIEFGTEIVGGRGEIVFSRYDVRVDK
ncbi:MAG: hypothetical protein P8107_07560 [Spirochaetia bacterium]